MMAVMDPTMIAGRLLIGFLLDHVFGFLVAMVALLLPLLTLMLMLHYDGSTGSGMLAAGILGICYGAELDLLPYLTSCYFGTLHYAAIFGLHAQPIFRHLYGSTDARRRHLRYGRQLSQAPFRDDRRVGSRRSRYRNRWTLSSTHRQDIGVNV
jgi:hypothetical protein